MTLKVTEVHIQPIPQVQGLFALARIVLNGALVLDGIGIHQKRHGDGYRLTYPTRRLANGESVTMAHPITPELSKTIEQAIFQKIVETKKAVDANDRHCSTDF